jgi:hypothetical protein
MSKPIAVTVAALCAVAALSPADSAAQTADNWTWQASLYVYLPTIGGSTTFPQSGAGSDVSLDASKIIDNLKMTFMGTIEASNGRWGMFTDVVYMDLGNTKSGTRDISIGGAGLPAGASANASYDLKGWAWTLAGTWRVASDPTSKMDLIAGARLLDMKQTLGWEVTGNVGSIPTPGRGGNATAELSNWDAIIGVKGRAVLGESRQWFLPYYVDVGAGESNLTWQAMAGIGYSFEWGDLAGAWRYLDYDMKSGKSIESMTFNGPTIAAVFRW